LALETIEGNGSFLFSSGHQVNSPFSVSESEVYAGRRDGYGADIGGDIQLRSDISDAAFTKMGHKSDLVEFSHRRWI
jgi:hypothetical protein